MSSTTVPVSSNFDTLLFSSGGVKGLAYAGALLELQDECHALDTKSVHTLVGVSIGSLIAFLLAVGYTPHEIYVLVFSFDLYDLLDIQLTSIVYQWGLSSTRKLMKFLCEMLRRKLGRDSVTFDELLQETDRTLRVYTVNLSTNQVVIWDAQKSPNMSIVRATAMSMCLPFLFEPIRYEGHLYTDGALLQSFPFEELVRNQRSLGFRVFSDTNTIDSVDQYISRVVHTGLSAKTLLQIKNLSPKQKQRLVHLKVEVGTVKFQLSNEKKKWILDSGAKSAALWAAQRSTNH